MCFDVVIRSKSQSDCLTCPFGICLEVISNSFVEEHNHLRVLFLFPAMTRFVVSFAVLTFLVVFIAIVNAITPPPGPRCIVNAMVSGQLYLTVALVPSSSFVALMKIMRAY